jgi:hypothetical protein
MIYSSYQVKVFWNGVYKFSVRTHMESNRPESDLIRMVQNCHTSQREDNFLGYTFEVIHVSDDIVSGGIKV